MPFSAKARSPGESPRPDPQASPTASDPAEALREQMVQLGAWQYLSDAHTGAVPDPKAQPRAVIVSTMNRDPFCARGDVQLKAPLDVNPNPSAPSPHPPHPPFDAPEPLRFRRQERRVHRRQMPKAAALAARIVFGFQITIAEAVVRGDSHLIG